MKSFLSILSVLFVLCIWAADPAQPKVGLTPVINATNGFGGVLTVRTQLNVGFTNQQGFIDISSTNGTYIGTFTVDADGYIDIQRNNTNFVQIGQLGEFFIGNQGVTEWGGLSQLTVENDVSTGDPLLQRVNFESIDSSSLNHYAGQYLKSDSTPTLVLSQILLDTVDSDVSSHASFALQSGHGNALLLRMDESGTNYVSITPGDGDGATLFLLRPSIQHTIGDMVEVLNQDGTVEFRLAAASGNDNSSTLFLAADGHYYSGGGGGGGTTINTTDGYIPSRQDGTTFTNSLLHAGSDGSTIVLESDQPQVVNLQFKSSNTNNSGSSIIAILSDSDGSAISSDINQFIGTGWGIGDPSQRNGNINFRTLHGGTLNQRLLLDGSSDIIRFYDKFGTGTNEIGLSPGAFGEIYGLASDGGSFDLESGAGQPYLQIFPAAGLRSPGQPIVRLQPNNTSVGSEPYTWDTLFNVASGLDGYHTRWYNNFTNIAFLTGDGKLALTGQTNLLSMASNQLLLDGVPIGGGTVGWFRGTGSPESSVTAPTGSFYSNESGGATNTFWVKESGSGNTGWINK